MLTPETLDRLEAQANAQHAKPIATGVILTPGQVLALIAAFRKVSEGATRPVVCVDTTTNRMALLSDGAPAGNP